MLHRNGIGAKANVKRLVPKPHPDRDRQFRYIQTQRALFEKMGWPMIRIDTKHQELIGLLAQAGTRWCERAPSVYRHDFPSDALARAVLYGIYDVTHHRGYLSVGQSADTPEFAVDVIVWWWQHSGSQLYGEARSC